MGNNVVTAVLASLWSARDQKKYRSYAATIRKAFRYVQRRYQCTRPALFARHYLSVEKKRLSAEEKKELKHVMAQEAAEEGCSIAELELRVLWQELLQAKKQGDPEATKHLTALLKVWNSFLGFEKRRQAVNRSRKRLAHAGREK